MLGLALLLSVAAAALARPEKPAACTGDFGTSIQFADSPKAAAEQARKEQKLVLILHISGHFEDPGLT
jgi:hypothetical protein